LSSDGALRSLTFPDESIEVAVGDLITAFPDASGNVRGLVKAVQLRERLMQFLGEIEAENWNWGDDFQAKHADRLIRILDQQISHQEEIIAKVLRRAPQDIKAAISRTKEEIEQFTLDSQDIKARVRAKFSLEVEASSKGQGSSNSGQGSGQEKQGQGSSQENQGQGSSNSGQGGGQEKQGQGGSNSGQGSGQDNQGQGSSKSSQERGQDNQGQGGGNSGQGSGQENQGQGSNSGQGSGQENRGPGSKDTP